MATIALVELLYCIDLLTLGNEHWMATMALVEGLYCIDLITLGYGHWMLQ